MGHTFTVHGRPAEQVIVAREGLYLAQFEGGECKECKHQGSDPEAGDDFGLQPARQLDRESAVHPRRPARADYLTLLFTPVRNANMSGAHFAARKGPHKIWRFCPAAPLSSRRKSGTYATPEGPPLGNVLRFRS